MAKPIQIAANAVSDQDGYTEESFFVLLDDGRMFYRFISQGDFSEWKEMDKGPWD